MKKLTRILDEVSRERGFEDFRDCTNEGLVYVVDEILRESAEIYSRQCLALAAENARVQIKSMDGKTSTAAMAELYHEDGSPARVTVSEESIMKMEIIF